MYNVSFILYKFVCSELDALLVLESLLGFATSKEIARFELCRMYENMFLFVFERIWKVFVFRIVSRVDKFSSLYCSSLEAGALNYRD